MVRTVLLLATLAMSAPAFADLLVSRGASGVDRYSDGGAFLGTLISPGSGGLVDAQGVAVLSNGDLLVGDFASDNVLRFDPAGSFLGVFASGPTINTPFDVVVGTGGDVFVANAGGLDTIARLNGTTGAVVQASFTSGNVTPIGGPQYMAFGPNLALTDIAGHVFRFDSSTGVHVSTSFSFVNPEGVAFAGNGDLYVASFDGISRIPNGMVAPELVIDGLAFPTDIAFGPDGTLYVLSDKVYRYDVSGPVGVLVDSFGTSGGEFLVHYVPIPEPGSFWLLGLGLIAMLAAGRRYRLRGF